MPSWSISAEMFAYLLFPLLALGFALVPRAMQVCALSFSLLVYLLIGPSLDVVVGLAPLRCLAGFALGMLLFHNRLMLRLPRRRHQRFSANLNDSEIAKPFRAK